MNWGFLLQDSTTGVVTWVGTILTVAGLIYTIWIAKGAKIAAERAVLLIQGQESLANIAFSYGQITLVKTLILRDNIAGAGVVFDSLKREIHGILAFLKDRDDLPGEIGTMKRNLKTIEDQFDGQTSAGVIKNPAKLMAALTGIATFLVEREQEMKFKAGLA